MRHRLGGLSAGLVLAGAMVAGVAGVPAPATAAGGYCSGDGVNVVVDFGSLGGGVDRRCAADADTAAEAFAAAGVELTRVGNFPGAVCTVESRPEMRCPTMPPADAYWGLFSSGGSGWSYSSVSVDALRVDDGDTVAFAWQDGGGRDLPATAPAAPRPEAPSSTKPSARPDPGEGGGTGDEPGRKRHRAATTPSPTPTASPEQSVPSAAGSPTAGPDGSGAEKAGSSKAGSDRRRDRDPRAEESGTPTAEPSAEAVDEPVRTASAQGDDADGGLPVWVPALVVVLLGAGGGAAVWRRRTTLR